MVSLGEGVFFKIKVLEIEGTPANVLPGQLRLEAASVEITNVGVLEAIPALKRGERSRKNFMYMRQGGGGCTYKSAREAWCSTGSEVN